MGMLNSDSQREAQLSTDSTNELSNCDVFNSRASAALNDIEYIDKKVISYIGGWIVYKVKNLIKDCETCCKSIQSGSGDVSYDDLNFIAFCSLG